MSGKICAGKGAVVRGNGPVPNRAVSCFPFRQRARRARESGNTGNAVMQGTTPPQAGFPSNDYHPGHHHGLHRGLEMVTSLKRLGIARLRRVKWVVPRARRARESHQS